MASDAPEDGDPPTLPGAAGTEAAFAATLAPERGPVLAEGSGDRPAELVLDEAALARASLDRHAARPAPSVAATRRIRPLESEATLDAPVAGELPPLPIVPDTAYLAVREVARGGMGRIVAAEDQRLGRTVALKELLDPAAEQLGRFQREALITARLQHPGIVPVYEAGRWPSGEPFFAMKLVSGRPLDRVIAQAKTLEARLALLPRIAAATDAMAYAHSQRVIHRDLKPANILIGEYGETVVIDWGLAKNLDELDGPDSLPRARAAANPKAPETSSLGSTLTIAGSVMGTPAYMAPEQARGEPVDQRADVFALGAMLYHLLAGVPPYNARTATDVIAAAATGKVVPLPLREPGAPPDLVAIVERAMAQLPIDRYADAGELATELRRFLTGQLVSAHRYTAGQRIQRFVRRHRAAVTIAALAAIGFAAGGTFAVRRIVHERDVADHERALADTRRQAAEHLIDKMLSDVRTKLEQIGRLDLLASLGSEIRNYYDTLAKVPGGMPADDLDRMAIAVDLVGVAERDSGKLDEALATWTGVRGQLADAVSLGGPTTHLKRRMIGRLDFEIGTVHQQRGAVADALASYTQAKHELDALHAEQPGDRLALLGAAEAHDRIGDLLRNEGKVDAAFDEYSEAKTERERAANGPGGRPAEELLALSTSHLKLGSVYQARGASAKALDEYRASLRLRESLLASQRDNVEVQNKLLEVELTLGDLQRQAGDPRAAIETYRKAVPVMDALGHRDPANTTWQRLRGNIECDYGFALLDAGEFAAGRDQLAVAIATQERLVARDPKSTTWQADLSRSYTRLGDAELYLGELDRAIADYQRALDSREDLVARDPRSKPYRRSVAWSQVKLAGAYAAKNEPAHALEAHERALAIRAELVDESPGQGGYRNELAVSEVSVGRLIAQTDPARSAKLIAAGVARARQAFAADPINNDSKEVLVQALVAQADAARATRAPERGAILAEALATARAAAALAPSNVHWAGLLAEIHAGLGEVAAARGDAAGAAAARAAIRELLAPLARTGKLAAPRKPLLDRAR
jgi:serine/threonine protein kinase/tetratricopeptide (TPR) repeat protein